MLLVVHQPGATDKLQKFKECSVLPPGRVLICTYKFDRSLSRLLRGNSVLTRSQRLITSVFQELRFRRILTSIDTSLSSAYHVSTWLLQLRRTRRSLDQESAATLVHAFVTSRVDYCNTLLAGAPKVTTDKLQRVLNAAARVLTGTHKFDRSLTQLLHTELHWLDIPERVTYKLGVIMFDCQHGRAPKYLIDYCMSTGLRCGVTAAPPFSQPTSSDRTASPSQHVRPPGFCRRWPDGLELFPG